MQPDLRYHFLPAGRPPVHVTLALFPTDHGLAVPDDFEPPAWARLEHHQCAHCPLDPAEHRHCPIARNLAFALPERNLGESFENLQLKVESGQREYHAQTTVQRALSSLFGLVCALSDCPHTRFLRPMALFHLPVSNETETLARTVGFYLLSRYLQRRPHQDMSLDLDDLRQAYHNLGELNRSFVNRLRGDGSDAPLNAMILLHVLSKDVNWEIEDQLDALATLFAEATGDSGTGMQ
ncbi:MAG: hypothetical protein ABGX87_01515 [Alcanivorax sp.]